MDWRVFVALRYLTKRRKEKFISIISVISILGVIVGVAALIVVLSIMTGFDLEIREKIIGTYSHIILFKEGGIENEEEVIAALKENKHVVASSPFIDEPAFLKIKDGVVGVLIRGLDEKREGLVSNVREYINAEKLDFAKDGVFIGKELLKTLRLKKGDKVGILSPSPAKIFPPKAKEREFVVAGEFTSGRYDYDANLAFIKFETAKELFGKNSATGIGIKVDNEFNVHKIKDSLQGQFRYPFIIKTWMDLDKNLMKALAIEKKIMFIILALIIIVACFNIASSLIMQVLEKTKDIGILRSIGATGNSVKIIFIFLGFSIGATGAVLGSAGGIAIAKNINAIAGWIEGLTGFELFPNDVYYLSQIPVKIVPSDVGTIALFSVGLAILASLYPAWKASHLNPVEAIRYE